VKVLAERINESCFTLHMFNNKTYAKVYTPGTRITLDVENPNEMPDDWKLVEELGT